MADVSSQAPLLAAVELSRRQRDDFLALDAVSLVVHPGEIYCLLGAAGAGKTLVLHSFLGLVQPTAGRVFIAGADVSRDPVGSRRAVTYIAKAASLYRSMTARQNVQFFTQVDGSGRSLQRRDFDNAMRRVGIPERLFERPAGQLDSAAALAVWLAIGLLKDAPVLLMDEPSVGLDPYASADLQDVLAQLRRRGKALLVATTDVLLAGRIADRIGIMKEGRKTVEFSRAELVGRPLPDLYLELLGRPLAAAH